MGDGSAAAACRLDWSQIERYFQRMADEALTVEIGRRLGETAPARSLILLSSRRTESEQI